MANDPQYGVDDYGRPYDMSDDDAASYARGARVGAAAVGRLVTQPAETVEGIDNVVRAPFQPSQITVNGQTHDMGFWDKVGAGDYNSPQDFEAVLNRPYDATRAFIQQKMDAGEQPSEDDVRQYYQNYLSSDDYNNFRHTRMPWDKVYTEKAAHAINDMVGAPQDEDQTTGEKVATTAIQLGTLSPFTVASKASRAAGLSKTADVLDAVSHGTFAPTSYEPKAFLANAAVGGALASLPAAATYVNSPSVPQVDMGPQLVDDYGRPIPTGNVATSTDLSGGLPEQPSSTQIATATAQVMPAWQSIPIFAMAAAGIASKDGQILAKSLAKGADAIGGGAEAVVREMPTLAKVAEGSVGKPFLDVGTKTGDTADSTLGSLKQAATVGGQKLADATDQLAPVQRMIAKTWEDNQVARDTMNKITVDWGSNAGEAFGHWDATGHMLDGSVIPSGQDWYATKDMVQQQMGPEGVAQYNAYVYAKTIERTMQNTLTDAQAKVSELSDELRRAANRGDGSGAAKFRDQITEQQNIIQGINNDDPAYRHGMDDLDAQTRQSIIQEGNQNPVFQQVEGVRQALNNGPLDMRKNLNLISDDTVNTYKERFGGDGSDYQYLQSDPYGGTTGLQRVVEKGRTWFGLHEDALGDPGYAQNFDPMGSRNVKDGDKPPQLNQLMDVWDATHMYVERQIRTAARERFINSAIEAAEAGPTFDQVGKKLTWVNAGKDTTGAASLLSPAQIEGIRAASKGDPFENLVAKNVGGKYQFYHFDDPGFKAALEQQPVQSWPILRMFKRMSQLGATGTLRPGFMPTALMHGNTRINAMRPWDSVNGLDNLGLKGIKLADKLGEMAGIGPLIGKETGAAILRTLRVADATVPGAQQVVHAMDMVNAIRIFADQNAYVINNAIQRQLATDTGFFGLVGRAPGGKAFLNGVSSVLSKAYVEGLQSAVLEGHAGELAGYTSNATALREVDKLFGTLPKWMTAVTSPLGLVAKEYRMMISSVHNASRISYALRMADYLDWKYDGKVPEDAMQKAVADARTLTGDLSRRMGNATLQKLDSTTAYNIVTLRGTQEVFRRAMSDPRVAAAMISGAVGPALFSAYWMSNHAGKDGYDYYWHQLSVDHRVRFNMVPTLPEFIAQMTGKGGAFDPKNYYTLSQAIEFRPFAQAAVEGARALGLALHNNYGMNIPGMAQNDKITASSGDHMQEAFKQAFSIAAPTLVDTALGAAGKRLETGNIWTGIVGKSHPFVEDTYKGTPKPGMDMMHIGSDIPRSVADSLSVMLASTGKILPEMLDTGIQVYKKTNDNTATKILDGLSAAGREGWERWTTDQSTTIPVAADMFPNAPFFGRGVQHVYKDTDLSRRSFEIGDVLKMWGGRDAKLKPQDPNNPIDQVGSMLKSAESNGVLKPILGAMSEYSNQLQHIDADKTVPFLQRNDLRNQILLKYRDQENKLMTFYKQVEQQVVNSRPGQQIAQMTGRPFNFEDFAKLSNLRAREMVQAPKPRRYTQ